MKKFKLIIKIAALLVIIWVIGSGFVERTDVYRADYSVNQDGENITLQVVQSTRGLNRYKMF